ncbi:MAG: 16S rRNA (guanine(966)-N(2))-methyltransferase RsmD [Candidatus Omnitrophica bacterium]|nr:16S rRNA (guanine(966)-N(2))-methyltransferase RsmD [Candidatus Omnitrophota bacterium]
MRIISGYLKGRFIKTPIEIRPTEDKVRKALFDILYNVEGLSILELFAGSGAVGIEALSRGAKEVVFVEQDKKVIKVLNTNLNTLGLNEKSEVLAMSAEKAIYFLNKHKRIFDIIFLDPPYYGRWSEKTLQAISECAILQPLSYVVVQHFKKDTVPLKVNMLQFKRQERYGDTVLSFYQKK